MRDAPVLFVLALAMTARAQTAPAPADLGPWKAGAIPAMEGKPSLKGVFFLDAKTGWACGDNGLVLSTGDGGTTWTKSETKSGATLRGVFFLDKDHGWICGDGDPESPEAKKGHIVFGHGEPMVYASFLSTEDGGATWNKRDIWTNFQLTAVATGDGKKIMLANSGGEKHMDGDTLFLTEGKFSAAHAFRALFGAAAIDEKRWVAVGSPVYVTYTPEPADELFTSKHVRAIYSDDGGKSWQISAGSDGGVPLRAVAYRKDAGLLAVGDKGNVLASEDLGATWVKRESGTDKPLRGVAWGSGKMVVAVGRGGTVIVSGDGGKTWGSAGVDKGVNFGAVAAAGEGFVAVTGEGMILRAEAKDLQKAAATEAAK